MKKILIYTLLITCCFILQTHSASPIGKPDIVVHPPALNFGMIPVSKTHSDNPWIALGTISLTNNSPIPATIKSISVVDDHDGVFGLIDPDRNKNILNPGESTTITVSYRGSEEKPATSRLIVTFESGKVVKIPLSADGFYPEEKEGKKLQGWANTLATQSDTIYVLGESTTATGFRPRAMAIRRKKGPYRSRTIIALAGRRSNRARVRLYRARRAAEDNVEISRLRTIPLYEGERVRAICSFRPKLETRERALFLAEREENFVLFNSYGRVRARRANEYRNSGLIARSKIKPRRAYTIQIDRARGKRYLTRVRAKNVEGRSDLELSLEPIEISSVLRQLGQVVRIRGFSVFPTRLRRRNSPAEVAALRVRTMNAETAREKVCLLGYLRPIGPSRSQTLSLLARKDVGAVGRKGIKLVARARRRKDQLGRPAHLSIIYDGGRIENLRARMIDSTSWTIRAKRARVMPSLPCDMDVISIADFWPLVLRGERSRLTLFKSDIIDIETSAEGRIATIRPKRLRVHPERKRCYVAVFDSTTQEGKIISTSTGLPDTTNHAPIAYAGWDTIIVATSEEGAVVTLNGYAYDPDGDRIRYSWSAPGVVFDNPTSPTPTATFPIGQTVAYLVAKEDSSEPDALESYPSVVNVTVISPTAIGEEDEEPIPEKIRFYASQFAPNPTSTTTIMKLHLPEERYVKINFYDVSGREVKTIDKGIMPPGRYEIIWDGTNNNGRLLTSGIYFARIRAGKEFAVRRVIIIR